MRAIARGFLGLLLIALLATSVWQCAHDTTRSGVSGLQLALRTGAGEVTPDTIEIELFHGGSVVAADTAFVDSAGHFSATLAAEAGEAYEVRVYAKGTGPALRPDSTMRGVVAQGQEQDIVLRAGRLTEVTVTLEGAQTTVHAPQGAPGFRSIALSWDAVPGASAYTLGWFSASDQIADSVEGIADTSYVLDWGSALAPLAGGESDSVFFNTQALFDLRAGVYGFGQWVDLSHWVDLPYLVSWAPAPPHEPVAADTARAWLEFDRPMIPATLEEDGARWVRAGDNRAVAFVVDSVPGSDNARFVLTPDEGEIATGTIYRVVVTPAVTDTAGRPFDQAPDIDGLQSAAYEWTTEAYSPLQFIGMDPVPGADDVDPEVVLHLIFNRRVNAETLTETSVFLTDPDGATVPGERDTAAVADTVLWWPDEPLWFGTTYAIHVTPELHDVLGRPFDGDPGTFPDLESLRVSFTIEDQPHGPRVTAVEPESAAVVVPVGAIVRVTFDEAVDSSSVRFDETFQVLRDGIFALPGTVRPNEDWTVYTFTPSWPLSRDTEYLVRVSGVTDMHGNPLDQDRTLPGYQPFLAPFRSEDPPGVAEADPADGDSLIPIDTFVALTFSRPLDPATITASSVQLTRGDSAVAATRELNELGDELTLTPAEALVCLSTYRVFVDTLVTAVDGSRFDQETGAGRQPYEAFFTTKPESLHPSVTAFHPAEGDITVAVGDSAHVTFSIPVRTSTVTTETFFVDREGEAVAGEVTVAEDSLWATFTPLEPLENETDYRVVVTTYVTSRSGFRLDQNPESPGLQDFVSDFRTAQETTPPRVIFVQPADESEDVAIDVAIALEFSETMDSASVATAFSVSANGTPVVGEGSLDGSGRHWVFHPSPSFAHGTAYDVVVDTTARDLVGNGLDQEDEPGAQPFGSRFTTRIDPVPPRVRAMDPDSGSVETSVSGPYRLFFTKPMQSASIDETSLRIAPEGGEPIAGSWALDPGDTILSWYPDTTLAFLTGHTVTADTLLLDHWGIALDQDADALGRQPYVDFFTTMAETLAPRVEKLLPIADLMPLDAEPTLVFSEPMDSLSLKEPGVIRLTGPGGAETITLRIAPTADTVAVVPEERLFHNTNYTVEDDTLAQDLALNHLDQDPDTPGRQAFVQVFTTEDDTEPPTVVDVSPPDGATNVHPEVFVRLTFSEPLDPNTVTPATVYFGGGVDSELLLSESNQVVEVHPLETLVEGHAYGVTVSTHVADRAGNRLAQNFSATFTVAHLPTIVWGGAQCLSGDTTLVSFDASSSTDADDGDSVSVAVWDWGDGTRDSLAAPGGLIVSHDYSCVHALMYAGCDSLDNDDDGQIDEDSDQGCTVSCCDESYGIVLRIYDTTGLSRADTAGVSFCSFLVRATEPQSGGGSVGPADSIRVRFTRELATASVTEFSVLFTTGGAPVVYDALFEDGNRALVIAPADLLQAEETYTVTVTSDVEDSGSTPLDQAPCEAGLQDFEMSFTVGSSSR